MSFISCLDHDKESFVHFDGGKNNICPNKIIYTFRYASKSNMKFNTNLHICPTTFISKSHHESTENESRSVSTILRDNIPMNFEMIPDQYHYQVHFMKL